MLNCLSYKYLYYWLTSVATTTLNEATRMTETSTDQDLLIQLRLFEVQNCLEWVVS